MKFRKGEAMKKVFRPHIILVTEGRFFLLFMIATVTYMTYMFISAAFFRGEINYIFVFFLFFAFGLDFLTIWLMRYFWQLIWGKLILEEEMIIWRCIFCKTVKMKYTDIKYVGIRGMGKRNVVHVDVYHTGFRYLLISSITPPSKPIDKIRCRNGVIKWAVSEKVCEALKEKVPPQWKNIISFKRY